MQYNATTPDDYLSALVIDWKKESLLLIRDIILKEAQDIEESIEYKMLRYGDEDSSIFHLNAQKNYVSLYVGDIVKIDDSGELLKGLDIGKGCIRIKKSTKIEETKIGEFIQLAMRVWKSGGDTSC